MIKASLIILASLAAVPAMAQSAPAPAAPVVATPDPATLAEARRVVAHLVPPGIYKKVMGPMLGTIMGSMADNIKALPLRQIAEMSGLDPKAAAALDKVRIDEVMAIYDPRWQERSKLEMQAMFGAMGDFFTTLEPELREAMARAYANHFTLEELGDIDRFFGTPSGDKFASQFMTISADPAMTDEMRSMMPKMMQQMPQFIGAAKKATASLPPPRKLQDLTPAEKDKLAKALGVDPKSLRDPKSTI